MVGALRIVRSSIDEHELPGAAAISTGRGAVLEAPRRTLRLTVEAEGGLRGVGEATPLPRFSPESVTAARKAIEAVDLGAVELDPRNPVAGVAQVVAHVSAAAPSARFAVETALLDAAARAAGVPLHRLLVRDAVIVDRVPLSALLDGDPDGDLAGDARRAIERGARTVKWKVGRAGRFDEELAALAGIRLAIGPDVALRLDGNGGLADEELEQRLSALAALQPEIVEEPSAAWLEASARPACPLAADESLLRAAGEERVLDAVRRGRCAAVVLKPMLLGGILACRALARAARALGADLIITHTFDGPVAMAAAAALAVTLGGGQRAAGLWPHAGLAAFGVDPDGTEGGRRALPFLDGGYVIPVQRPGLGLSWP